MDTAISEACEIVFVTDGAFGLIDNTAQADFIGGVVDNAEICNEILDFLALIEAQATDNSIRNAGFHKNFSSVLDCEFIRYRMA